MANSLVGAFQAFKLKQDVLHMFDRPEFTSFQKETLYALLRNVIPVLYPDQRSKGQFLKAHIENLINVLVDTFKTICDRYEIRKVFDLEQVLQAKALAFELYLLLRITSPDTYKEDLKGTLLEACLQLDPAATNWSEMILRKVLESTQAYVFEQTKDVAQDRTVFSQVLGVYTTLSQEVVIYIPTAKLSLFSSLDTLVDNWDKATMQSFHQAYSS